MNRRAVLMSGRSLNLSVNCRAGEKRQGDYYYLLEMPELLGITDRILVMSNGLVPELSIQKQQRKTKFCVLRLSPLRLGASHECVK